MSHIPPRILEQKFVLVLNVQNDVCIYFAFVGNFDNSEQLMLQICIKWKPQASDNLLLLIHQRFLYFQSFYLKKVLVVFMVYEHVVMCNNISPPCAPAPILIQ